MSKSIASAIVAAKSAPATVEAPAAEKTPSEALAETARMLREIEELKAANAALRASSARTGKLSLKVSEKGALSIYGMGRFPVTLYREQWERLLGAADEIRAFISANGQTLKIKGE